VVAFGVRRLRALAADSGSELLLPELLEENLSDQEARAVSLDWVLRSSDSAKLATDHKLLYALLVSTCDEIFDVAAQHVRSLPRIPLELLWLLLPLHGKRGGAFSRRYNYGEWDQRKALEELTLELIAKTWQEDPSPDVAEGVWRGLLNNRRVARSRAERRASQARLAAVLEDRTFCSGSIGSTSARTFSRICSLVLGLDQGSLLKDLWQVRRYEDPLVWPPSQLKKGPGRIVAWISEGGTLREVALDMLARVNEEAVGGWLTHLRTHARHDAAWFRAIVKARTREEALHWLDEHRDELRKGHGILLSAVASHPLEEVHAFWLELVREGVMTPELALGLLESGGAEAEQLGRSHFEAASTYDGLELLCKSKARSARALVRTRVGRDDSLPTEALLAVARGSNQSDTDWAISVLTNRAAGGEEIPGFSIVGEVESGNTPGPASDPEASPSGSAAEEEAVARPNELIEMLSDLFDEYFEADNGSEGEED
jgi:hypothetical protein